jgi:site-specific recombinase XerD
MLVRHALRRMHRTDGRRQEQAPGLTLEVRNRLIDHTPATLRGLRDAALLAIAYDTLLLRSELVALNASDLERGLDGSATLLVRWSKTEQDGEGTVTWLAPDTLQFIDA